MTDTPKMPDVIWASTSALMKEPDMPAVVGVWDMSETVDGTPYVPRDLTVTTEEANAMVVAAYEAAARAGVLPCFETRHVTLGDRVADAIRSLTPTDATAALEARDERVRAETVQAIAQMLDRRANRIIDNHDPVSAVNELRSAAKHLETLGPNVIRARGQNE